MKSFGDTFTITAYEDVNNDPFISVVSKDVTDIFRVVLPGSGERTSNPPRVVFSDGDGELAHPKIHATSIQSAAGAAMKVSIDRLVARLIEQGHDPFEEG